jgi:predicted glycoside hydrolase/deacetylase ChbG (UPF0249 family)
VRCVIVNGDDLGISPGVNRGIAEAHRRGVLTSASLLVDRPASRDGAEIARHLPGLSVGLHADITELEGAPSDGDEPAKRWAAVLARQLDRFEELVGRPPTHLDSHHNVHRDPRLLPHFRELADRHGLPLREHSRVRHVGSFYGQWDGQTHRDQIGVDGLLRLLDAEIADGVTEIGCHPGYVDGQLRSSYRLEREVELATLCDPTLPPFLSARGIRLVSFAGAAALFAGQEPGEVLS